MKAKILGLLAAGLLAGPMVANAIPIIWDLNATLASGGSLGGVFTYDADTSVTSAVNILLNSPILGTHTFTGGNVTFGAFAWDQYDPPYHATVSWAPFTLTNAGGSGVVEAVGGVACDLGVCPINSRSDLITGGTIASVNSVPEPGTLALVTLGLAGLGLSRRRKAVSV